MAITKNKKPIPKGKLGEGLRKLKTKAPIVGAKMGYKKKGGVVRRASGSPSSGENKKEYNTEGLYSDTPSGRKLKRIDKKVTEFLKENAPVLYEAREKIFREPDIERYRKKGQMFKSKRK